MLYNLFILAAILAVANSMRNDYSPQNLKAQITNLPGLPSNANFTMFSGYITVDSTNNRNLFYWFVESLKDAVNDPVVLWTNGGPGCSGLLGFFTENGPLQAHEDGTSLYVNSYSWVNVANMLFIEAPAGVGFSYSDVKSDYVTNDNKTAIDNYDLIRGWLNEFTNYQSNDFYISSESYGGHYMPTLAQQITIGNKEGKTPQINFKGVFVGNPFTDPIENKVGQYDTWYGHSLISRPLWTAWYKDCHNGNNTANPKCTEMEGELNEKVGNIDPYALDFDVCNSAVVNEKYQFMKLVYQKALNRPLLKYWEYRIKYYDQYGSFPNEDNYVPCSENYATTYLNHKDVQSAIHVKDTIWKGCSDKVDYSVESMQNPMEPTWKWLVSQGNNLHITVVSGDDDSVCGTMGTQSWIFYLGYQIDSNYNWTEWLDSNNQVGGYQTKFLTSDNKPALNFVTVHSAGHMIPQTQPQRSLEAFTNFLAGKF